VLKILLIISFSLNAFSMQASAQTHKKQEGSADKQPAADTSPVAPQQRNSPKLQPEPDAHVSADVRVVSTPSKDRYDKAAFWVNITLAAVGMGGIGIAVCSLVFIRKQTGELRLQRIVTHNTLNAIKEQANLMKRQANLMEDQNMNAKDRERARLIIRQLETPELFPAGSTMDGGRALKVRVIVENLGGSRAFNVRAWGMMNIVSERLGDHYDVGIQQVFPSIIDADLQKHFLNVSGLGREFEGVATVGDYIAISEELAQRIRNGEVFIVASGNLAYEDKFLDTYETPFHFVWHSFGNDNGSMWLTESYWLDRSERPRRVHADKTPEDKS
jgi:hypothetical protein